MSGAVGLLVGLIIGMIIGIVIVISIINRKSVGDLRIDDSDPDGVYLFLELKRPVAVVAKRRYVILRVNPKSYIPRD